MLEHLPQRRQVLARILSTLRDPDCRYLPPPMVTAWGRRPDVTVGESVAT